MVSSSKRRGASAPRSPFRGPTGEAKPKTKTKTKPKPKPKTKTKTKTKPKTKPKPKLTNEPKTRSEAKASANAGAKPTKPTKPARPARPEATTTKPSSIASGRLTEQLGEITCPSGTLAIFDIGLIGYLPRPALDPMLVKVEVPRGALAVTGTRIGSGRFADCWDHVAIKVGSGEIVGRRKLGDASVDFARLACIDLLALDHWQHDESLDGLADVAFWGRDESELAKLTLATRNREGYGWANLSVAAAEAKLVEADRLRAAHRWLVKTDFRPHSHHFHALAAARASTSGAGVIEVAGAQVMLLFTSWGDGVFPIYLDLDAEGRPVRIRIQLATAAATAAMHAVN